MHGTGTRVQAFIGDPVSDAPEVPREDLEEIFQDIQKDIRYDHELNGCLNCGACTATCRSEEHTSELQSRRNLVCLLRVDNINIAPV